MVVLPILSRGLDSNQLIQNQNFTPNLHEVYVLFSASKLLFNLYQIFTINYEKLIIEKPMIGMIDHFEIILNLGADMKLDHSIPSI